MHARKIFDLFADDADAAFIGGIEFEDTGFDEVRAVELFGECEDCGCFAGAWWAIEELSIVSVIALADKPDAPLSCCSTRSIL